jgi:hypothetical protein
VTVSNEDRDAAARVIINARMLWATSVDPAEMDHPSLAGAIMDALIAHGWGPRPTVDPVIIRSWKSDEIIDYLRECGIEVAG